MVFEKKYDVVVIGGGVAGAAGIAAALTVERQCCAHDLPAAAVQEVLHAQGVKLHFAEAGLTVPEK